VRFIVVTARRFGVFICLLAPLFVFGCGVSHAAPQVDTPTSPSQPSSIAPSSVPRMASNATSQNHFQLIGLTAATPPGVLPIRQVSAVALPGALRNVQVVVDEILNALTQMDGATAFWLATLLGMLVFYTFENRSIFFTLGFAIACWTGSTYAFLHGGWPFGVLGGIWGFAAVGKAWQQRKTRNAAARTNGLPMIVWPARSAYVLAVIAAIVLLITHSPVPVPFIIPVNHAVIEALPLLLTGVAFLAWLTVDRPAPVDLIKQALIALAFLLWGIDLLMPAGPWATFVGAVVIAIYVFDLAWLMEGSLRKMIRAGCTSPLCKFAGVCCCDSAPALSSGGGNRGHRPKSTAGSRDN